MKFRSTGYNRGISFKAGGFYVVRGELILTPQQDVPENHRYLVEFGVYPEDAVPQDVLDFEARIDAENLKPPGKAATPNEREFMERQHDRRAIDPAQQIEELAQLDPRVNPLSAQAIGHAKQHVRAHGARVADPSRTSPKARAESLPREVAGAPVENEKPIGDLPGVVAQ
jgi:hypothetical protein